MNPLLVAGAVSKGKSMVWGLFKWIAIIGFFAICGWGLYAGLIRPTTKPNPTETQTADQIINHNYNYNLQPKQTLFGCTNYRVEAAKIQDQAVRKPGNRTITNATNALYP